MSEANISHKNREFLFLSEKKSSRQLMTLRSSYTIVSIKETQREILDGIEREAELITKNFCQVANDMKQKLNQISATSVCCTQTYLDSVNKLCESVDQNIQKKNDIISKAQDLSANMKPIYELNARIKSIKRVVELLETQL